MVNDHPNISVWMSVTRDLNYGFTKWVELSNLYGTEFGSNISLKTLKLDKGKNCFIYQNESSVVLLFLATKNM